MNKRFVAYFYCNGVDLSLGISVNFKHPNIEIHVPFGFFRLGWQYEREMVRDGLGETHGAQAGHRFLYRSWGYGA